MATNNYLQTEIKFALNEIEKKYNLREINIIESL